MVIGYLLILAAVCGMIYLASLIARPEEKWQEQYR